MYSGDIDLERDIVAAGTVFRVLLIWRLSSGEIIHRLEGHTGVIFDTVFLDRGMNDQEICVGSVSDDRTVRVWSNERQVAQMFGHTSRIWKLN